MPRRARRVFPAIFLMALGAAAQTKTFPSGVLFSKTAMPSTPKPAPAFQAKEALGQLPLIFKANMGQTDSRVRFGCGPRA